MMKFPFSSKGATRRSRRTLAGALTALALSASGLAAPAHAVVVNIEIDLSGASLFGSTLQSGVTAITPFSISPTETLTTNFTFADNLGLTFASGPGGAEERFEIIFTGGSFPGVSGLNTLNITSATGDLDDPTAGGPDNIGFVGNLRQAVFHDLTDTTFTMLGGTMTTAIGPASPGTPVEYTGVFIRAQGLNGGSVSVTDTTLVPEPSALALLGLGMAGLGLYRVRTRRDRTGISGKI